MIICPKYDLKDNVIREINSVNPLDKNNFSKVLREQCAKVIAYKNSQIANEIMNSCGSKINVFASKFPDAYENAIGLNLAGIRK